MESFFSRYKNALVLMLVVLTQVVLLAMQVRRPAPNMQDGHNIRLWRYWVASVVTPPERLAHGIGLRVRGVWSNYINLRHLREQNQSLQDENTRLRLEQAGLVEDARQGQRLREMLDFRGEYIDTTLPAQVIGTSGTDQAHVIYIDKGSKDGIRPQMAVITPDGVIGKVKNVFPNTAQVLLISDQTSGAGVMLQTTRIRGVMKGNVSGQPQMINISPDERIQPGEVVLTSGGDQVYPRGLPVGVVEKVVQDPDTSFVSVVVKPNANLSKLEEVLVITGISDKMPFGEEKDMMQSEVDAYAEKQRAADILSEKLPSLRDANTPESTLAGDDSGESEEGATSGGGDPARPMRPPQPLHPDRYTPGAAPAAASLTPGEGPAVKYPSAGTPETEAPKTTKTPGSAGSVSVASDNGAAPKSRFPSKPATASAPIAGASAAGGVSSGSGATTAARPTGGSATAAGSGVPLVRPASRPAGSGLDLPLQPADSQPRRAIVPLAGGSGSTSTTTAKVPRPAVVGGVSGTASSTTGSTAGQAGGSSATPPASHKIAISSDSGGILTPAGMGSIGTVARPKPVLPAGTTAAGTASTGASGGAGTNASAMKPASPKPATSGTPSSGTPTPRPATAKPQTGPSQQPVTPPRPTPQGGY